MTVDMSLPTGGGQRIGEDVDARYQRVRRFSEAIAEPLSAEDCAMQTMSDVSPTRWHLAHTTWFFETFLLKQTAGYQAFDERFECLFNSYYNSVSRQFPRDRRGTLSRPSLAETLEYRRFVDDHVLRWLSSNAPNQQANSILELGLNHEQQHQELMLTDIKHVLFCNPLYPEYRTWPSSWQSSKAVPLAWEPQTEGVMQVGHLGDGFGFDNEYPRHKTYLQSHSIATRCVTNADYLEFMQDGGYARSELWLSLGWSMLSDHHWQTPLYWVEQDREWFEFTLAGLRPIQLDAPVCHVSYFEADAFARWAGFRLPTEFEWETCAADKPITGVFADGLLGTGPIHPCCESLNSDAPREAHNMFGNVWEWTSSPYAAYPGFQAANGALGEYNGKFMCNQFVLRGGSCATSSDHIRPTYRNFFPPEARWQFSGIRLAK